MTSHLEIQAPSSTTVSYVVSSKRKPASWTLLFLRHVIRALIAGHAVLLVLAKALQTKSATSYRTPIELLLNATILKRPILLLASTLDFWMIAVISTILIVICLRRDYTGKLFPVQFISRSQQVEESLLVLQGLGVQTSTTSAYYLMSSTTTFIPTTQIQDIVIHEAFKGLEVRFYLAIIVEGATEVVVVFPVGCILLCVGILAYMQQTLLPRVNILQEVWRGARKCLYTNGVKQG